MAIDLTAIILSVLPPIVVAIMFYASQGEKNIDMIRRLILLEEAHKELDKSHSDLKGTTRIVYEGMARIEKQNNEIYTELSKINTELKDIYKNGKK